LASPQSNHKPKLEYGQDFILGVTSKNQVSEKHTLPTNFRQSSAGMSSGQARKWLLAGSGFADERPANPVARIFKGTANDSPSPVCQP
jgi:hypothetical protein